mgnify:CR=1 FL=1
MNKFKVLNQITININKEISYLHGDLKGIIFWELQDKFSKFNSRNSSGDQKEFITKNDIKEFATYGFKFGSI